MLLLLRKIFKAQEKLGILTALGFYKSNDPKNPTMITRPGHTWGRTSGYQSLQV